MASTGGVKDSKDAPAPVEKSQGEALVVILVVIEDTQGEVLTEEVEVAMNVYKKKKKVKPMSNIFWYSKICGKRKIKPSNDIYE